MDPLDAVLAEVRAFLARDDNDFAWSQWSDREQALRDYDALVAAARAGGRGAMDDLVALFLPTAGLQEVSVSSGWGDAFLRLADRLDRQVNPR